MWVKDVMKDLDERDESGKPKWQRKLCKGMGRLADMVPGFDDCSHEDSQAEPQHHESSFTSRTKSEHQAMLQEAQDKSKRLQVELDKEKANLQNTLQAFEQQQKWTGEIKSQLEAKDREFMKEKANRQQKDRLLWALEEQVQNEESQNKYLKSKLEATVLELDAERIGKSQAQHQVRQMKDQGKHLKFSLETKVRELEKDISMASKQHAKLLEANQAKLERLMDLEKEVEIQRARANLSMSDQQVAHEEARDERAEDLSSQLANEHSIKWGLLYALVDQSWLSAFGQRKLDDHVFRFLSPLPSWLSFFGLVVAVGLVKQLGKQLHAKTSELHQTRAQLSSLQMEFNSELGGMLKMRELPQNLGSDFMFHVFDEKLDQGTLRSIKIQCPGVRHSEVSIEIMFNGCLVKISRESSQGVDATHWEQRFQFRPSEGWFEFEEDQATLDRGFLTLVFRAYAFHSRPFRFPQHFDLHNQPITWEYTHEGSAELCTEPSVHDNAPGTASGLIEMAAAVAAEFEDDAAAVSADTDSHEATKTAMAPALVQASVPIGDDIENLVPVTMLAGSRIYQSVGVVMQAATTNFEDAVPTPVQDAPAPVQLSTLCSPLAVSSGGTSEGFEKVSEQDMSTEDEDEASPEELSF